MRWALPLVFAITACQSDAPSGKPRLVTVDATNGVKGVEQAGRPGDYLLFNDSVRFAVQTAASGSGLSTFGGALVDADLAGANDDRLQELFAQCDLRALAPARAEIIDDGSSGGPAILRLTGSDRGIPLIDSILRTDPLLLEISVDYVLPREGRTLEVIVRAKDVRREGSRDVQCGLVIVPGDSLDTFVDGEGFQSGAADSEIPFLSAASPVAKSSFAIYRASGGLSPIAIQAEVVPLATETRNLPTAGVREERFFFSLGDGDIESALVELRRHRDDGVARVSVELRAAWPAELANAHAIPFVTIEDTSRPIGDRAVTAVRVEGAATVQLPPGEYVARAELAGFPAGDLEFSAASGAVVELPPPAFGVLEVATRIRELEAETALPTAGLVHLLRGHGAPTNTARVFEAYAEHGERFVVPSGEYTLVISHGPECDLPSTNVTIRDGAIARAEVTVRRVVDSSGMVSADFHVHGSKSMDADADRRLRVLGAVAEGLDLLLSTDHDIVTDYGPFVTALGLGDQLSTVPGIEESALWGHINGFPLVPEVPARYFALPWFRYGADGKYAGMLEAHEVTEKLYEAGAKVVQINHPRGGQGVFSYVRLGPNGQSEKPWPRADAFEILNGKRFEDYDAVFKDLVALARAGKKLTATGVSDAHGAYSGVGYARTMVLAPDTHPLDLDAVWASLKAGHAVATTGPVVRFTARAGSRTAGIGDTLVAPGPIELDVEVQAPSWVRLRSVEIFQEDAQLFTAPVETATVAIPAVRFKHTITATATADTFFLAIVRGDGPNPPVIPRDVFAITNPIHVDVP